MLGRSCLGALLTQNWEVFHRAGALNVVYNLQIGMHAWYFEYIVGLQTKSQSLTAHTNPPVYEVWHRVSGGTSGHGIDIVVLNKWMKCATKTQSLFTSTPCSHKSHMNALVANHDFIVHLSMMSFTHFEDFAIVKMAARVTGTRELD